jgi:hypothetical protein
MYYVLNLILAGLRDLVRGVYLLKLLKQITHQHEPSSQTCVGSLGITCEIDDNLDILCSGGRTLFRRRLKDLVETYLPNVETPWRYVELNSTQYYYRDFLLFKCFFGVLSEITMRLKRSLSLRPCKGSLE